MTTIELAPDASGAARPIITIPDVEGQSLHDAAVAYAQAGLYVVPVRLDGDREKHAGSVLGKGWPAKSSRDPETVSTWWTDGHIHNGAVDGEHYQVAGDSTYGIALHCGRSGLVAFDLDRSSLTELPGDLADALRLAARQRGRQAGDRGHYVYATGPDRYRNTAGEFGEFGEVRGNNGIIMVEPTPHGKASQGGVYRWERGAGAPLVVPAVPDVLKRCVVRLKPGEADSAPLSSAEFEQFLADHNGEDFEPARAAGALRAITDKFVDETHGGAATGASIHMSMFKAAVWAFREAAAGAYPAKVARDELDAAWRAAWVERRKSIESRPVAGAALDGADVRASPWPGEFEQIMHDTAGAAVLVDPDDTRQRMERGKQDDSSESSWVAADIAAALDAEPPTPTHMVRTDGVPLMYAGKAHSVHGESESGKSWLVQAEAARVLKSGAAVLYLDFESEGRDVARRLLSMGVERDVLMDPAQFVYVNPEVDPDKGSPADRENFAALLRRDFSFAVVDGVTDSMSVFGLNGDKREDVSEWIRRLPKSLALRTGAAVAVIDHVNKDSESRGRFATGSQHKMSGLDGPAFVVEMAEPFGIGLHGVAKVRVGKDRPGQVRPFGGPMDKDQLQHIGDFHLDSTDPGIVVATLEPQEALALNDPARAERNRVEAHLRKTVPTDLRDPKVTSIMEDAWKVAHDNEGLGFNALKNKVKALRGEKPGGPKANPTGTNDFTTAIELLVKDGHIVVTQVGQKKPHHAVMEKPYTELADPRSRKHHEAQVGRRLELTFADEHEGDGAETGGAENGVESDSATADSTTDPNRSRTDPRPIRDR